MQSTRCRFLTREKQVQQADCHQATAGCRALSISGEGVAQSGTNGTSPEEMDKVIACSMLHIAIDRPPHLLTWSG